MPSGSAWPVPFVLDPLNLDVGSAIAFCISVLLAVLINAEGQAFVSTFLGDRRDNPKDRLHFNVFLHLSLLGTICYLVGGFGWPRTMDLDAGKFEHPRAYTVISRAAGPVANLLLASIFGSVAMVVSVFYDPRVLLMVIGVNVTTAVYHLILLPPMAGGCLVAELIPPAFNPVKKLFYLVGPFLLLALALLERLQPQGIVSPFLNPIIISIFNFIRS